MPRTLERYRSMSAFADRHIGPRPADVQHMLAVVGVSTVDELIDETIPADIRLKGELDLPGAMSESDTLDYLSDLAGLNAVLRSFIGMGYYDTITPTVILRNILEDPGWYTAYTPYQAEIAQGRLEALLNFQTMVSDLTGLDIANASLLDEATAAAEAMTLARRVQPRKSTAYKFFVSELCHPQTIEVIRTRAAPLGYDVVVGDHTDFTFTEEVFGGLVQYPATDGSIHDYETFTASAHDVGAVVIAATDLLALTLLTPPGEWGADVAVGNSQRFGVPMGFGGPHAAFMAIHENHVRSLPGRLISVSKDTEDDPALRMALQTREQHIRRDAATSNICTAQVLLAVVASMYAVYHGPEGLREIARTIHVRTSRLAAGLTNAGYELGSEHFFDTITVATDQAEEGVASAAEQGMNLRLIDGRHVGISLDEATTEDDVDEILALFGAEDPGDVGSRLPPALERTTEFLAHPVFNSYHSETELLRYINRLRAKDLSLVHSMIPLGSCTMKLNATSEMIPITWSGFGRMHPFAPIDQSEGYATLFGDLEEWLADITGFAGVSLQPNAGSQGEYSGLLAIRRYHETMGEGQRNVCLIPASAHGTNPASAVMAGMEVVVVATDDDGNVDIGDLTSKAAEHADRLGALMITYPSTHGVFETTISQICAVIHEHGGQVYLDGANMNAQVGLSRPGDFGADVCHLNLHKTFCIPHGGGGPGVGPIGVAEHLVPFLPGDPLQPDSGAVSAARWGSASILPISYAYIAMMGSDGLRRASEIAILNANYIAARLEEHFPVLYRGAEGRVAHECIIDVRPLKQFASAEDIAKRLMDYGFHAPTMSWPVAGTLMIEPTESESLAEIDRFCDAMISIREEIREIEDGKADPVDNVLHNAPHTAAQVARDEWTHPYSRKQAAYPAPWL
ncbi:MAG: aminomethyl-transferring glycine dehydrogenase, partial [Acidimicrobiia bacterium]|nr:aminomethyl-transferring glycine dehydrogenase [Acidimicrobiia bacterium]NNL28769.1 aminomethyl-transferring glycine dehydrogenase [Acidimicrobiia bacterium]